MGLRSANLAAALALAAFFGFIGAAQAATPSCDRACPAADEEQGRKITEIHAFVSLPSYGQ